MDVAIFVPLAFFALVFGLWYIFVTTRNKERLALIEKGADPELFKSNAKSNSGQMLFKLGLFFIGIAIGIVAAYFLSEGGMDDVPAYFSMIFLFGGIGLVVSFLLQGKIIKE